MNNSDLHAEDDSDSSDEDYIPRNKPEDVPSEVDSDGDPEDALSDTEITNATKSRKRKKNPPSPTKKQKLADSPTTEPSPSLTEDEKKKKDDDLWSDFMKDTGFQSKSSLPAAKQPARTATAPKAAPEKVKITQVFEFAGEEVKMEKEVAPDSAEARLLGARPGRAKAGLSGIGGVLSQLGKKPKISTLEKTKLDWDRFKKDENLEEELQTHNKGKDGYLERQDFLQRADLRRFEIEKKIRTVERNKRMTN